MSKTPVPRHTVVARNGVGYRHYRIPALAAVGETILLAFDGRPELDDLPAPIDLLLRRSVDGGRTWNPTQVVRTGTGLEGFGDPSLLTDPATGRVLLFHAAGVRAGFFESGDGEDEADPDLQHTDLSVSDDAGLTWTHRRLTAQLRASGNAHLHGERISGLFVTSGAGCAVTEGRFAGRLVQPCVLRIGDRIDVACALSDDHGETWRLAAPLGAELNESSVTMLPGGDLLLHSRSAPNRIAFTSVDGGETFGPGTPVADLLDPSVNGSVLAFGGALFASHCADEDLRRSAVVSRSDDGGATWHVVRYLEPGSAAYTQLAALPDGRLGVAYEADGYREIRFEAFDPDQEPEPRPDVAGRRVGSGWVRHADPSGLVLDVVLRGVVAARPDSWEESGPTHAIDLSRFEGVSSRVFKEIGQDRDAEPTQVLRTRESLDQNLGPVSPDLRTGDRLELEVRVANRGPAARTVTWDGQTLTLEPGESWVRRDLSHHVTADEVESGRCNVAVTLTHRPAGAGRPETLSVVWSDEVHPTTA